METNEPVKITKKIVGYKVVTQDGIEKVPDKQGVTYIGTTDRLVEELEEVALATSATTEDMIIKMVAGSRVLKRPLRLDNEWRLKPPYANHALYVRLNAIEHKGKKYPYEIFFNTKDVKDIKWLNALTVTISTAFRTAIETGTSLQPLIDNFKESCDTESPYLSRVLEKPKFVNGLVAEIGLVIEVFNKECLAWNYSQSSHERPATEEELEAAILRKEELDCSIAFEGYKSLTEQLLGDVSTKVTNPCPDCGSQLTKQAGCDICTNCGYSKCS